MQSTLKETLSSLSVGQMLAIMHCPLCRPLFDVREGVIVDCECHKKGFMRFIDPDFGNPSCFCLPLDINLFSFCPGVSCSPHLLFLFIPPCIFCFVFPHSTDWFHFPKHVLTWSTLKFPAFSITSLYSNKTEGFLLIFVVKE